MAEGSLYFKAHDPPSIIGPDLFGYYKREIVDLLTDDENWNSLFSSSKTQEGASSKLPDWGKTSDTLSSAPLFSNSLEDAVADSKIDLLKASLRQIVAVLSHEVKEMIDPVRRIRYVINRLHSKRKQCSGGEALVTCSTAPHCKKLKTSSSDTKKDLLVEQITEAEEETGEVSEDLKLLLGSDNNLVEEIMTKHSDEVYRTLNHMELQLEEILDAVVSKCRLMTRQEMQQLAKVIQKLPPQNLDRILEIINHGKSANAISSTEITVDLEKQGNAALWRLFFNAKAVKNARELAA